MSAPDAARELRLEGPLDLRRVLGLAFASRNPTYRLDTSAIWRSYRTVDGPATLRARSRSRQDETILLAEAWGPGAHALVARADRLLGVTDDRAQFEPKHPLIKELHHKNPGLRISGGVPVMNALVPHILGQRVKGTEAADSFRAMCFALGGSAPGPQKLQLPPDPRKLARMPPYQLHRFGVERSRAETIVQCCARMTRLRVIEEMPPEEAFQFLQKLRGIGPWTAALAVIDTHGWQDAVVRGDYHLPNVVAWALAQEPRADDERMEVLLAPYAGQRWRVIRLLYAGGISAPKRGPRQPTWRDAVELASDRRS